MKTRFVTDKDGNMVAVILPIKEYDKILDDLEELEGIKLYDSAKEDDPEYINVDQAFKEIEKKREKQ